MSLSEPFFINILAEGRTFEYFDELDELAHRAFSLAEQYPASTSGVLPNMPSGVKTHHFAVVLYPVENDTHLSPVKAILHQNPPSRPARVIVDFQTKTAVCEGQEANLAIHPEQIDRVQEEIKLQLRGVWESNGKAHRSASHADWADFLQQLESQGILAAESFSHPSIHRPCPLCDIWTARCMSCRAILCLSRSCAVSRAIPSQSCSQHVSTAVCLPCLGKGGLSACLGQCPQCKLWSCNSELVWCLGRPKDLSDIPPDTVLHSIPGSARKHPATPIACLWCAWDQGWRQCVRIDCWSTSRGCTHTSVCDSCSPEGGLTCACKEHWMCDVCRANPLAGYFEDCPRCGKTYCPDLCNYIGSCGECGRSTLCDDCFDEDWSGLGLDDLADTVVLTGKCSFSYCKRKMCKECLQGAQCAKCTRTICTSCTVQLPSGLFCDPCHQKV